MSEEPNLTIKALRVRVKTLTAQIEYELSVFEQKKALDRRCLALAKNHLQEGLMALNRSFYSK